MQLYGVIFHGVIWVSILNHTLFVLSFILSFIVKLALVVDDEHPFHIAFETEDLGPLGGVLHRDGSISRYIDDPSGNKIELIKYPIKVNDEKR